MKAGLLLPKSSTHPLIAHNFVDGLNSFLKHHQLPAQISCVFGSIGFGTDPVLVQQEADRLLMEHQVDLLVIFADYPVVACLFPTLKALNKLLIVVNHAAKYPASWQAEPNVIHHTLNNALNCWLTGKQAAKETSSAAVVSSYYDGGYSINHALTEGFTGEEGEIVYNFVGHQSKAQFDTQSLVTFLNQSPQTNTLLAVLSGELVPEFYLQLNKQFAERTLNLYASPVLLEESILNNQESSNITVSGYTSWFPESTLAENITFCERFKNDTSRHPDSFAVLGWDTGLILQTISDITRNTAIDAKTISRHQDLQNLQGAKGNMQLHPFSQQYISPVHYRSDSPLEKSVTRHTIALKDVTESFNELTKQEITGFSSEWLNTYLCS